MTEEQLQRLTELDRQKTDFMATVSHELRTPLTSINGYIELLEDGDYGALTPPQLGALAIIERNATRLRGLIEDLLVLNKIEATGLTLAVEEVSVADLVRGVVDMLRPVAESGGVALETDLVDDNLVVRVDRGQLERTLINLGANAVKFTPRGGTATLGAFGDGEHAVISVSDTGVGVSPEDMATILKGMTLDQIALATDEVRNVAIDGFRARELSKLSVPLGLITGLLSGWAYNRFNDIRLPSYLAFFGGRRFVPIVCGVGGVLLALVFGYSWHTIAHGMDQASKAVLASGSTGVFLYGVLNRALIVTGYLLYYAGDGGARAWISVAHWAIGLALVGPLLFHSLRHRSRGWRN